MKEHCLTGTSNVSASLTNKHKISHIKWCDIVTEYLISYLNFRTRFGMKLDKRIDTTHSSLC